jgi:2-polyprenyl-3-methyl-5-hydroxy-6-metoxy-1,4-benzoquinol methylase
MTAPSDTPGFRCAACRGSAERASRHARYVRCAACGSEQLQPMATPEELTAHYAAMAVSANYAAALASGRTRSIEAFVEQSLPRPAVGALLLELGSFDGALLLVAERLGYDVIGVEPQPAAAASATERIRGTVFAVDAERVDFASVVPRPPDVIVLRDVFEHLLQPEAVLRSLAAVSTSTTVMVLQTPEAGCLLARTLGRRWPSYLPPEHTVLFSRAGLGLIAARAGWTVRGVRRTTKPLSVEYVLDQLENMGKLPARVLAAVRWLTRPVHRVVVPFYGGEATYELTLID